MDSNLNSSAGAARLPHLIIAVLAALSLTACRSDPLFSSKKDTEEVQRVQRQRAILDDYSRQFDAVVSHAADQIVLATPDLQIRRASVYWKLAAIPLIYRMNRKQDKIEAFLGMWYFTEAMTRFYDTEASRSSFGDTHPLVESACQSLLTSIDAVAHQALPVESDYQAARSDIDAIVDQVASKTDEDQLIAYGSVEVAVRELRDRDSSDRWLPSISLSSFNPFGGLDESAVAIRYLADKADASIHDVLTELPWRLELLLYDVEERQTTVALKEDLAKISDSAVTFSAAAESLPQDLQAILDESFREIEAQQGELRQTLQAAQDAVTAVHATLTDAEPLVAGLSQTAASLTEAGVAWDATFQTLGLGADEESDPSQPAPADDGEPARPFDILDYRDTAGELREVALELRGLVGDVKGLAGQPGEDTALNQLNGEIQTTIAGATDQGRDLVDHIMLRAIQLLGLIFGAALAYRLLVARIQHPSRGS